MLFVKCFSVFKYVYMDNICKKNITFKIKLNN